MDTPVTSPQETTCSKCGHVHWCEHDNEDFGFCCKCGGENRLGDDSCGPWEGLDLSLIDGKRASHDYGVSVDESCGENPFASPAPSVSETAQGRRADD